MITVTDAVLLAVSAVICLLGVLWTRKTLARYRADPTKLNKRNRIISVGVVIFGAYLASTRLINVIYGSSEHHELSVELWAKPRYILGLKLSETIVNTWIVMAVITVLAVIIRLTVLRRMTDVPRGIQNALEFCVERMSGYTKTSAHGVGDVMAAYLFSVAALLAGCAVLEMFGARTPASDITFTVGLSVITFFLINWYGIKKKGVAGRVKSLMEPAALILPIKIITDIAIPVSLASRLFGNMLAGMIIMDLLYSALGNNAIGIPSVAGLFFNVFHPLLQAFIFITLTLTFISEAVE